MYGEYSFFLPLKNKEERRKPIRMKRKPIRAISGSLSVISFPTKYPGMKKRRGKRSVVSTVNTAFFSGISISSMSPSFIGRLFGLFTENELSFFEQKSSLWQPWHAFVEQVTFTTLLEVFNTVTISLIHLSLQVLLLHIFRQ